MALEFISSNIEAFGGNPKQITLMGQSAGATSIGYHLLSPKSVGLFSQVVAESNPLTLPLKNPVDGAKFGSVFRRHLNCRDGKDCLLNATISDIIAAQDKTNKHFFPLDPFLLFYPWTPCVDEVDGVTAQPIKLLMEGKSARVPGIFGTVANESVIFIYLAFGPNGMSPTLYDAFLLDAFPLHYTAVKTQVRKRCTFFTFFLLILNSASTLTHWVEMLPWLPVTWQLTICLLALFVQ